MEVPMSRLGQTSLEPLEPYDGKLSSTVLRGESPRKGADLLDNAYKAEPSFSQKLKSVSLSYGSVSRGTHATTELRSIPPTIYFIILNVLIAY